MKIGSRAGDGAEIHRTPGFDPQHYTNWVWWHMLRIPTCEIKRQHRKIKTNLGFSRAYLINSPYSTPTPKKSSEAYSQACQDKQKPQSANEESYMEENWAALPALRQVQPVSHVFKPLALVPVISNPHWVLPNMNKIAILKNDLFCFIHTCFYSYISLCICVQYQSTNLCCREESSRSPLIQTSVGQPPRYQDSILSLAWLSWCLWSRIHTKQFITVLCDSIKTEAYKIQGVGKSFKLFAILMLINLRWRIRVSMKMATYTSATQII